MTSSRKQGEDLEGFCLSASNPQMSSWPSGLWPLACTWTRASVLQLHCASACTLMRARLAHQNRALKSSSTSNFWEVQQQIISIFCFLFPYIALQGIIWVFCMRMMTTLSRWAVGVKWSWFHSMSRREEKHFRSNCQNWPLINTGTTETQFCRTCK